MNKRLPWQVGITGGIGSGKSTVARIFAACNVPVYDADSRAKWLMSHDPILKTSIQAAFGLQAYSATGELDRVYLAAQVFHDPAKTNQLNQLVHPRVGTDYTEWVERHSGASYVLKEAALLFESGSYQTLDQIIVVQAPAALRMQRVLRRDSHRRAADVEAVMARQMDEAEKVQRADFVIHNDGSQLVIPQVLHLHNLFNQRANQSP